MDENLRRLPLAWHLPVAGEMVLECFCGEAALTLGLVMSNVPCIRPWDSKFGEAFNVLVQGWIILNLILDLRICAAHFGTPCKSFTWARWPQLRSAHHPLGLPGLGEKQQLLVNLGNDLLTFTIKCCMALHSVACYFSIENPERSWMWLMEDTIMLSQSDGIELARFLFKDFGVPFFKPTLMLHNTPTLHLLSVPVEPWPGRCIPLRGKVWWNGAWEFRTKVAEAYPPALGARYGALLRQSLDLRNQALAAGNPVPFAAREGAFRLEGLLSQAEWDLQEGLEDEGEQLEDTVVNGLGAKKGLKPLEHVTWTQGVTHPANDPLENCSQELWSAIDFEIQHEPEEIDDFRRRKLAELIAKAKDMSDAQAFWASGAEQGNRTVVEKIHGPLLSWCLQEACGGEKLFEQLCQDLQQGFPLVGDLPPCEGSRSHGLPKSFPRERLTESDLRKDRKKFNDSVMQAVKPMPFSEDILPATIADWEQGFMSEPRPLTAQDLLDKTVTRRIPVREERSEGWRTRIVDHETESFINEATRPQDRVRHDGLGLLAFIVTALMLAGVLPELWKRDVSSAFRRVPILAAHLDLSWVVWWADGRFWIAQHVGMPFGTVSAVYAWHRVGHALLYIVMSIFKAPMGRYVDDFFGACRQGVHYTGGVCLTILAALLGFPTDDAKDADNLMRMVVLGATVIVDWPGKSMQTHVAEAKAERWREILLRLLNEGKCSRQEAAAMAGRLSFSVTTSANRVGRAFIKPFYAQQMAPLHGNAISERLEWAIQWFAVYLEKLPVAMHRGFAQRQLVVTWHDAAGESRWVAAVIRVKSKYFWTRIRTPQHLWDQLTPREDEQIGFQELLGAVLVLGTFAEWLSGTLWVSFGDNDGVTYALAKGGGHNEECNMVIGKLWLAVAELDTDLHVARVESKANIADGPSRDDISMLNQLQAVYVEPVLPQWIHDLWHCQPNV